MCVTFLCTDGIERGLPFKLILINNRDEMLERPTSESRWEDGYLAGRDEFAAERGTWLGITKDGRIGNILSITEPLNKAKKPDAPSRGAIAKNFLTGNKGVEEFGEELVRNAEKYHGFHFVGLQLNAARFFDVYCLTNRLVPEIKLHKWPKGLYGFGNSPRSSQMQKVVRGEKLFEEIVGNLHGKNEDEVMESLMTVLKDTKKVYPCKQYEIQTETPFDFYQHLTSLFVRFPPNVIKYGTRCHTIILIDKDDRVTFKETRLVDVVNEKWQTNIHTFTLQ
ncbi:unnamed protein product [Bursaphelenchus xylophilus]|uniref:(pine wood nematode) hypothetical protein n=1 Tax=Bursaphelenchus xylophilus TaxID=6326 RepID=A0A1I7SHL0_BURXY|nr:unnamed protein product [Bursaphelenchus xylophilus]CAG9115529.1 unnamed protein product [Bursaphelenchus xylophilus]